MAIKDLKELLIFRLMIKVSAKNDKEVNGKHRLSLIRVRYKGFNYVNEFVKDLQTDESSGFSLKVSGENQKHI